jgi:hypothetical protein
MDAGNDITGMKNAYLAAGVDVGEVMGVRVLEVLFLSVSLVAGTLSVCTMLERCAASGDVGIYSEPRWPQAANKPKAEQAKTTFLNNELAILLLWLE